MSELVKSCYILFPEITLAIGAMVLMLVGAFSSKPQDITDVNSFRKIAYGSLIFIALAIGSLFVIGAEHLYGSYFNDLIVLDKFAIFTKFLILIAGFSVLWISIGYCKRNHKNFPFEYSLLILLSLCGMLIMTSAADFLTLYLGLEMQSLALYVLAAINRHDAKSSEAAVKYFVLGALASGVLLSRLTEHFMLLDA